jgi:hypothetical protein
MSRDDLIANALPNVILCARHTRGHRLVAQASHEVSMGSVYLYPIWHEGKASQ